MPNRSTVNNAVEFFSFILCVLMHPRAKRYVLKYTAIMMELSTPTFSLLLDYMYNQRQ